MTNNECSLECARASRYRFRVPGGGEEEVLGQNNCLMQFAIARAIALARFLTAQHYAKTHTGTYETHWRQ